MSKPVSLITLLFISSLAHGGSVSSTAELLELMRRDCRYAPEEPFRSAVSHWRVENLSDNQFRLHIDVRPKSWARRERIDLMLSCVRPDMGSGQHGEIPPAAASTSARTIIELEDSGGRYGRNIAFEEAISAANWRGTVAYIDSTIGDGRRTRQSTLIACDEKIQRPCIEAQLIPPRRHSKKSLRPVVDLIRSIAHAE